MAKSKPLPPDQITEVCGHFKEAATLLEPVVIMIGKRRFTTNTLSLGLLVAQAEAFEAQKGKRPG